MYNTFIDGERLENTYFLSFHVLSVDKYLKSCNQPKAGVIE